MEGQAEVTEQLANAKDSSKSTPTPEELIKPITSLPHTVQSSLKNPGSSKQKSVKNVTFAPPTVGLDGSGRVNDNKRKVESSKSLRR